VFSKDLLLAEFVVADLTVDNPNVWYEIGVRHAVYEISTNCWREPPIA
jgi:hypothetical protein